MDAQTIIENNRLIAEFMGGIYKKADPKYFGEERYYDLRDKGFYYLVSELKYHLSWDWLMPVVEKIDSGRNYPESKQYRNFRLLKITDSIEQIYFTCVEFIKWHNENCKNQ